MNNKNSKKIFDSHPRIKIYYLRNQSNTKQSTNPKPNHLIGPSIECLSSLIQNDKNDVVVEDVFNIDVRVSTDTDREFSCAKHQDDSNPFITKKFSTREEKSEYPEHLQIHKRNAYKTETINKTNPFNNYDKEKEFVLIEPQTKRIVKSSHQNYTQNKNQRNNEALSQKFLSNIVKEWNEFDEKNHTLKKLPLGKLKKSIESRKIYKPEEIYEARKNKTLMKEHFRFFLETQQQQNPNKKQKSLSSLKTVFHREQGPNSFSTNRLENIHIDLDEMKISKRQNPLKKKKLKQQQEKSIHGRRFSQNQKLNKPNYLRLMYGPEVKLIPRLFEERSKIRNFDWTRLDQDFYQSRRNTMAVVQGLSFHQ